MSVKISLNPWVIRNHPHEWRSEEERSEHNLPSLHPWRWERHCSWDHLQKIFPLYNQYSYCFQRLSNTCSFRSRYQNILSLLIVDIVSSHSYRSNPLYSEEMMIYWNREQWHQIVTYKIHFYGFDFAVVIKRLIEPFVSVNDHVKGRPKKVVMKGKSNGRRQRENLRSKDVNLNVLSQLSCILKPWIFGPAIRYEPSHFVPLVINCFVVCCWFRNERQFAIFLHLIRKRGRLRKDVKMGKEWKWKSCEEEKLCFLIDYFFVMHSRKDWKLTLGLFLKWLLSPSSSMDDDSGNLKYFSYGATKSESCLNVAVQLMTWFKL